MKNSCLSFLRWSLVIIGTIFSAQAEKITFPAADGLEVAPRLVGMGFHCLAVEQRSGKATSGVTNEAVTGNLR